MEKTSQVTPSGAQAVEEVIVQDTPTGSDAVATEFASSGDPPVQADEARAVRSTPAESGTVVASTAVEVSAEDAGEGPSTAG